MPIKDVDNSSSFLSQEEAMYQGPFYQKLSHIRVISVDSKSIKFLLWTRGTYVASAKSYRLADRQIEIEHVRERKIFLTCVNGKEQIKW
ncbi:hypothetical protein J6590_086901 [Homalodisca vitripennis]|nr:hypothetical protein J6590_086901 [Homalodisca vitripennis]